MGGIYTQQYTLKYSVIGAKTEEQDAFIKQLVSINILGCSNMKTDWHGNKRKKFKRKKLPQKSINKKFRCNSSYEK